MEKIKKWNLKRQKSNYQNLYGVRILLSQILKVGIIILGIKENKKSGTFTLEGIDNINNVLKDFWNNINNKEKVSSNILNDDDINMLEIENKKIVIIKAPRANRRNKPIYINNNPITGTLLYF